MMKLEGLVATLINERELAINIGAEDDVIEGMIFSVREQPISVRDPKSSLVLGQISREKIKVKVTRVEPKFSVARTFETYTATVGSERAARFTIPIPSMELEAARQVTKVRTLRKSERTDFDPLDEFSSLVKVGDPVVLIEDPREVSTAKQAKSVTDAGSR